MMISNLQVPKRSDRKIVNLTFVTLEHFKNFKQILKQNFILYLRFINVPKYSVLYPFLCLDVLFYQERLNGCTLPNPPL
jgi:hypothetical protein